jgi:SAM-dependent methyltransferase
MHPTALQHAKNFFARYVKDHDRVLDVGSKVAESIKITYRKLLRAKHLLNMDVQYDGMDIQEGNNVDFTVKDPYRWAEIDSDVYDIVFCASTLEHSEFFWLVFKEMARVLKRNGYLCVIVPAYCKIHRFPVDCWRILPDGMRALARYTNLELIGAQCKAPSYKWVIDEQGHVNPNDTVGVFRKP